MSAAAPLTVVDTLILQKNAEAVFAQWRIAFETALDDQPGRDGGVTHFHQPGGFVHLVHRFADRAAYDAWLASDRRRALASEAAVFAISRRQSSPDRHPCFGLPGEASAPPWKRILVSWATVFPLLLATSYVTQVLVPGWPRPLTLALSSLAITLALNLLIFPRVNRRLEPWLLEAADGGVRTPQN